MSYGNIFQEQDTGGDFEDDELQSQLYAEIYYEPNVNCQLKTTNVPIMQLNGVIGNSGCEIQNQSRLDNQSAAVEDRSLDLITEFVSSTRVNVNRTSNEKRNSASHEPDNVDKMHKDFSPITKDGNTSNSSRKRKVDCTANNHKDDLQESNVASTHEARMHSNKDNVSKKRAKPNISTKKLDVNVQEDSDSAESIFEIPVLPKPKPVIIELQDSEEEDTERNTRGIASTKPESMNNKRTLQNVNSKVISPVNRDSNVAKKSKNCKDTSSKKKSSDRLPCNKDASSNVSKRLPTASRTQEPRQDVILNCTPFARRTTNINGIGQSFRNEGIYKNQNALIVNENQKSKKNSSTPKDTSNISQANDKSKKKNLKCKTLRRLERIQLLNDNKNNMARANYPNHANQSVFDDTRNESSCSYGNIHWNNEFNNESNRETMSQYIIEQSNRNIIPQSNNSREKRNAYFITPMSETLRNKYFSSNGQKNFNVAKIQRGMSKNPQLWMILDEDMKLTKKRAWKPKCKNCNEEGHRFYKCPMPTKLPCCYICGTKGHLAYNCPNKMCLTCGKQQSVFRKTCDFCRILYCTMCNSLGHELQQCPDLWRRYHHTITMDNIPLQDPGNVMKPQNQLYCCNCAKNGHDSSMCKEYWWSQHFSTPAAVTDYVNGPVYTIDRSEINFDEGNYATTMPPRPTSGRMPISQSSNVQQAIEEFSTNTEALPSIANEPTAQEEVTLFDSSIQIIEENLSSPATADESLCPNNEKNTTKKKVNELNFTKIIYSCGKFDKNRTDVDIELFDLDSVENFSPERKKAITYNMVTHKILPLFFEKLNEKLHFEVIIGFVQQHEHLMIQITAAICYVRLILKLMKHWIYMPDEEKTYGIDVTLSMNSSKLYNLFVSRGKQIDKMHFVSYETHLNNNENDPRWLFNKITNEKNNLKLYEGTAEYSSLRKKLWRLQIKLLMIFNTQPEKCNKYIEQYKEALSDLKKQSTRVKCSKTIQTKKEKEISDSCYLKYTLIYNHLFVPHTPRYLRDMLRSFGQCEMENSDMLRKKQNTLHTNENINPPATFCTTQNTNFNKYTSMLTQPSTEYNGSPIERNDVNDVILETSTNIIMDDRNKEEIFIIDTIGTHDFQTATPLTTEQQMQEYTENEVHLPRNNMDYRINSSEDKQNAHLEQRQKPINSTKKQNKTLNKISPHVYFTALKHIKSARKFKSPHMINVAEEAEKRLINHTFTKKHMTTLTKLINIEKKHQKHINAYFNHFHN